MIVTPQYILLNEANKCWMAHLRYSVDAHWSGNHWYQE